MSFRPAIENLEPRRLFAAVMVNDPKFTDQTDLQSIGINRAWTKSTGNLNVVVANIDSGLAYTHPDVYPNVWINQDEIPGFYRQKLRDTDGDGRISFYDLDSRKNRRWLTDFNADGRIDPYDLLLNTRRGGWSDGDDADANGYTDDLIGWDFADGDNNPFDFNGHGTHTSGTIAAQADNGIGISGIAQTSLMVVKIFGDDGDGATQQQIADAIRYSADEGARVSNNSWGYTQPTFGASRLPFFFPGDEADYSGDPIYQAIAYAGERGQLFVAAAGNDTENNDFSFNGSFPASYDLPNIVSVAAVTDDGRLSDFSNYGERSVDLAAPGEAIVSTWTDGRYAIASGTSMAAPHVTGTLALMLARYPKLTTAQAKNDLLASVDVNASVYYDLVSGGTLDAGEAVYRAAVRRSVSLGNDPGGTATALAGVTANRSMAAALFSATPIVADSSDLLDRLTA